MTETRPDTQTPVNDSATSDQLRTPVTQRRSRYDQRHARGFVYFIRGGDRIKIGFSGAPKLRLKTLQIGNGEMLELLKVIPGDYQTESDLHDQFRDIQAIGDWFHAHPKLLDYIAGIPDPVEAGPAPRHRLLPKVRPVLSGVLARRRKVGAETTQGYVLTNLAEQARWLADEEPRPWATHPMQTVKGMMAWQSELLAAAQ